MKTYDPKQVVVTFGPIVLTPGYGEDTFITFEPADVLYTKKSGTSGEVVRSRSRNRMGTLTVSLLQSSAVNDLLSVVMSDDYLSGTGVLPLVVKDLNGTTLLSAKNAWIEDRPHAEFAKEAGEREWVFAGDEFVEFHGGSTV